MKDFLLSITVHIVGVVVVFSGVGDGGGSLSAAAIGWISPATSQPIRPTELRKPTPQELLRIAAMIQALKMQAAAAQKPALPQPGGRSTPPADAPANAVCAPPPPIRQQAPAPPLTAGDAVTSNQYAASEVPRSPDGGDAGENALKVNLSRSLPLGTHDESGVRAPGYQFSDASGAVHRLLMAQNLAVVLIIPAGTDDTFVFDGSVAWLETRSDNLKRFAGRSPPMPPDLIDAAIGALRTANLGPTHVGPDEVRFVCVHNIDQTILQVQRDIAAARGVPLDQLPSTLINARVSAGSLNFEPADGNEAQQAASRTIPQ